MSDSINELFTAALGVAPPWKVAAVRFEPEAHTVHFDLVCGAARLPCPACGALDQPIHDRLPREWQHLHFFQYRALLHAQVPRVRCARCGQHGEPDVRQVAVPWARERSGFSLLFEAMVVTLAGMSKLPVRQIGALLGVGEGRLWRSLGALVDEAHAQVDMREVKAIGIDEKHVGRGRVVTVVHEAARGRVLHVSEGAKAGNVAQFTQALREHGGEPAAIERCSMDMGRNFIAGVAAHLPRAEPCFDPFHIVKLANEAVDAVRRAEVTCHPELRRTRYHWLKDAGDWTRREVIDLHWLRHSGLKTARAWRMKERLRDILAWRQAPHAPVALLLQGWIRWARHSRLPSFKRLGATLREHWDGVCNMLRYANSNARAESINADVQAAIARARGFRTFRNLRTMVYLLKAGLALPKSPYARVTDPEVQSLPHGTT